MLERFLLVAVLSAAGFLAYQVFSRYHLRRVTANAAVDPLLSDLKPGIPAIVYFTTPACIPCRTQQQPALARLQADLGDCIQIVRIDATEDAAAAERWGVFSAPTTFVIDALQKVREVNYGVADAEKLRRQVEATRFSREVEQPV